MKQTKSPKLKFLKINLLSSMSILNELLRLFLDFFCSAAFVFVSFTTVKRAFILLIKYDYIPKINKKNNFFLLYYFVGCILSKSNFCMDSILPNESIPISLIAAGLLNNVYKLIFKSIYLI